MLRALVKTLAVVGMSTLIGWLIWPSTEAPGASDARLFAVLAALGVFAIGVVVLAVAGGRRGAREQAKAYRAQHDALYEDYQGALSYLSRFPDSPDARLRCLATGRAYYSFAMPDTYTEHFGPHGYAGTSDYQNNTAGREARIAADIDARVAHLKARG